MNFDFFKVVALIIILLISQFATPQSSSFRKLMVEDGLSNNFVRTIHKDQWGYTWFGTLEGLDRFDGVELRSFSDRFPSEKPSVNCMANDPKDGVWIGTESGLYYWNFVSDTFEEVLLESKEKSISSLIISNRDSVIYIGSKTGLFSVNCQTRKEVEVIAGIFITDLLIVDNEGVIYAASTEGLIEFSVNDQKLKIYRQVSNPYSALNNFTTISQIDDRLVLGTQTKGLFWFDCENKQFTRFQDLGNNYILTTAYDQSGQNLFVGTDGGGMVRVDIANGKIQNYTHELSNPTSLSSNSIYSILIDDAGRYWVGTYSAGVNFSKGLDGDFQVLEYEAGAFLGQSSVRSLNFSNGDKRFIGTRDGFYILDLQRNQYEYFSKSSNKGLRSNIILSFFPITENKMLIGTYGGGISVYHEGGKKLELFMEEEDFISGAIYGFQEDHQGNLWMLSLNGIYKYHLQSGALENFNENNSAISDNRLYSIYFDRKNRLWLGSMGGVEVFDIETGIPREIKTDISLPSFKCVFFHEDINGNIWIATEQGGLYQIRADLAKIRRYTEQDGLPSNSVSSIAEYPENFLWISTLKGLCRLEVEKEQIQTFSLSDGLPGLVFNPGAIVNKADKGGQIWMGNEKGLVHFCPDSIDENKLVFPLMITDFYLEGKRIEPGSESLIKEPIESLQKIRLKGNQNSFGFRFVVFNYFSPTDNQYLYRLRGDYGEWRTADGVNRVSFQNIKPGNYVFEVCLAKSDGKPDLGTLRSIKIDIEPLLYQNPLIIGGMTIFLLGGLFLLYMVIRNLRRKVAEGQRLKKERELREKYESSRLGHEKSREILTRVISFMNESQAYLNADLKVSDVGNALTCSAHDISQAINQNLNKTFNEFINSFRVEAVKRRMSDPEYTRYTLMALAQSCGFNSKTSFYRIFKKETGQTPAEYLKNLAQEEK